jgi:uncharacterized protein (DUF885 family)
MAAPVMAQQGVQPETGGSAEFNHTVDEYFEQVYFKYAPTSGTLAGLHQYDAQLEDYSRQTIHQQIFDLHTFEHRFLRIPRPTDLTAAGDYDMVISNIRSQLLILETMREWEKNADSYSSGVASSAFSLMERKFASPDERLRSLVAREKLMPAVLQEARENLVDAPRIYTEIAIQQIPDTIGFFRTDVPKAFVAAKSPALKKEFAASNAAVVSALQQYQIWLQTSLLPRSHGEFRIGAENFQKKLLYDEMVDIPIDKLLEIGQADLHKNQAAFDSLAKEIDPTKTPRQILEELMKDHPTATQILPSFRNTFASLISFIQTRKIVTIPSPVKPILEETPPYMRATTFASMDTPGPYEDKATEAYFNVTLPESNMTPQAKEELLQSFNVGTIISTSVHEAYPGHYIQFLWVKQAPSKVRKLLGSNSNAEGWAHYCEQMMLDEGYGQPGVGAKNDRESKLLRLGQLQDALLRDARFVVGIRMHTQNMSMDDAIDFFVKEGYQSHNTGVVETKRGTSDPTYLYYTLGKLEILKLRADVQQKEGAAFSLQAFHDEFLKQGSPPIKIVRRAMLGDDSPAL